jgi:hypothetical protein
VFTLLLGAAWMLERQLKHKDRSIDKRNTTASHPRMKRSIVTPGAQQQFQLSRASAPDIAVSANLSVRVQVFRYIIINKRHQQGRSEQADSVQPDRCCCTALVPVADYRA